MNTTAKPQKFLFGQYVFQYGEGVCHLSFTDANMQISMQDVEKLVCNLIDVLNTDRKRMQTELNTISDKEFFDTKRFQDVE